MTWYTIKDGCIDFRNNRSYVSLLESLEITVKDIIKNYVAPYRIMVSGGLDSQTMLYAWKMFGRDFIPTSIIYNNNMNNHDLVCLKEFALINSLDIEYRNFDVLGFYTNGYDAFAIEHQCVSPHFAVHIAMTKHLDGTIIFGGDRLSFSHTGPITPNNFCLYIQSKKRSMIPYFLLHTPEIAYSLFQDLKNKQLLKSQIYTDQNELKFLIYQNSGIPILKPMSKYTGFEKIKEYYDINFDVSAGIKIKYANKPSGRNFDLLLRYPYEEKVKMQPFKYLINDFSSDLQSLALIL